MLHLFFNRGIKGHYPNDRLLVQNVHATFWQRSGNKSKVVTTGIRPMLAAYQNFSRFSSLLLKIGLISCFGKSRALPAC
jgi:hypothetical protein